jgi:AIG2 family protein
VPAEGSSPGVYAALYDLTEADERTLDAWEGADHGLYRKVRLRVHTLAGDVVAYVYALDAFEGGLPSARHLGAIADAAEAAGAPDDYLAGLRARDCRSTGN